jgi:hypothetical protein
MEKFSSVTDGVGKTIRDSADRVRDGTEMVIPETDINIFIEHHRTQNTVPQREVFCQYQQDLSTKSVADASSLSITENYLD